MKSIHPFPARMAADIALQALRSSSDRLTVLDPMMGSGTVPAYASTQGHQAVAFDVDPLAIIMSRVRCTPISPRRLEAAAARAIEKARRSLRSRAIGYPDYFDDETVAFARYWFDRGARRQLSALTKAIEAEANKRLREALWCALSRLIIVKSVGLSLAIDVAHSRPHRFYTVAPLRPLEHFERSVAELSTRLRPSGKLGKVLIELGDARCLPLPSRSADVVITSPPYLNAIDYMRGHRLSLIWMGWTLSELRLIRSNSVGSERRRWTEPNTNGLLEKVLGRRTIRRLPDRQLGILLTYATDMKQVVNEISRVLRPRGHATLVVGNSYLKSSYIENDSLLEYFAHRCHMRLVHRVERPLLAKRRYLPPPASSTGALRRRMRKEKIMSFERMS